jgi:flagellar protein FlbD
MIKLTRLDGREFVLNAEFIETFEATPETVITLIIEKKRVVVRESVDEVLHKVMAYKRAIFSNWPIKTAPLNEEHDLLTEGTEPETVPGHVFLNLTPHSGQTHS